MDTPNDYFDAIICLATLIHVDDETAIEVMQKFKNHEYDILVSTSVIEVGVDVPNATAMIIEGANRFGLAQLHQFRGRVGRGDAQAWCVLIPEKDDEVENQRLQAMAETNDGFKLAEMDLEMRGPGEIFGFRQHGLPQLRLADPARHLHVAQKAGAQADLHRFKTLKACVFL